MLKGKCKDHEDRIARLEVDTSEARHNNDKDHVRFDQQIHSNRVDVVRDGEQIKHLWEEINKFKDASVGWSSGKGGNSGDSLGKIVGQLVDQVERFKAMKLEDKISQIRINTEDINKLRKRVDSLE